MSMRKELAEYLQTVIDATPGLEKVRVVPSVRNVGTISQPLLIVKTDAYERLAAAPFTKRQGNFTLTLVSKHQDIDEAEDELDALLEVLLPALLTASLGWTDATQVGYGESNLAYDIRVTSILTPVPPAEPEGD
jgi:hypothetical protein